MKELSIEEKAKAYDEAIERVRELLSCCIDDRDRRTKVYRVEDIESIFPELKEPKKSEDERIRKMLIKFFGNGAFCDSYTNGISDKDIVAWLEAQGEQPKKHDVCDNCDQQGSCVSPCPMKLVEKHGEKKPVQKIEPTPIFKIGDILKRKGKDYTFRVDRIQGGYYHCDRNHGAFFPIEEQGNWELVEQKPAWSEEDEAIYYGVIETEQYMLDVVNGVKEFAVGNISIKEECTKELNWLKSLKDRVQPQPKQEWSEEDEYYLNSCITKIEIDIQNWEGHGKTMIDVDKEIISWLKSLRPRNTWKPSEEQIRILELAIDYWKPNDVSVTTPLYNLLKQLKKLREE